MTIFSDLNTDHLSLDDLMTVTYAMTEAEIAQVTDDAIAPAVEYAEIDLDEKLRQATYPRHGYTTAQVMENDEQYEVWLKEVLADETAEYRQHVYGLIKAASDKAWKFEKLVYSNRDDSKLLGIGYMPPCPICYAYPLCGDDNITYYPCTHYVGAYAEWYDPDENRDDLIDHATHVVVFNIDMAGRREVYFNKAVGNTIEQIDIMTSSPRSSCKSFNFHGALAVWHIDRPVFDLGKSHIELRQLGVVLREDGEILLETSGNDRKGLTPTMVKRIKKWVTANWQALVDEAPHAFQKEAIEVMTDKVKQARQSVENSSYHDQKEVLENYLLWLAIAESPFYHFRRAVAYIFDVTPESIKEESKWGYKSSDFIITLADGETVTLSGNYRHSLSRIMDKYEESSSVLIPPPAIYFRYCEVMSHVQAFDNNQPSIII